MKLINMNNENKVVLLHITYQNGSNSFVFRGNYKSVLSEINYQIKRNDHIKEITILNNY